MQSHLTPEQEIQQVELTIEQAKKFLGVVDAIERLERNEDFKKVVFDGYFNDEAARLVGLLAEPTMQRPDSQGKIQNALRGISEFRQHLLLTKLTGEQLRKDLAENEELLVELRGGSGVELDEGEEG